MRIKTSPECYKELLGKTEPALLVLTLLFVGVALLVEYGGLSDGLHRALFVTEWLIWAAFPLEFVAMLCLAPNRGSFLRQRWWEVAIIVVTLPSIPGVLGAIARPLRFLRSARGARTLRLTRLGGLLARYSHGIRIVLTRHGLHYVLVGAVVLYAISISLVYFVERGGNHPIQSLPDALWWGVTAITTLPDEGNVPVTTAGKGVAVFVVMLGLTLVSLITANISAFLVHSEEGADSLILREMSAQLNRIEQQSATTAAGANIPKTSDT